jgi:hypothetical protein
MNETPRDRDEADAAEEALESRDDVSSDATVPEADALEQSQDATRRDSDDIPKKVGERPEADALEQARGADGDDSEERR